MEVLNYFREGMTQYRKGQWESAMKAFREALSYHPGDRLSQTYIERCDYMKAHPPGDDWSGVWVMKSK